MVFLSLLTFEEYNRTAECPAVRRNGRLRFGQLLKVEDRWIAHLMTLKRRIMVEGGCLAYLNLATYQRVS